MSTEAEAEGAWFTYTDPRPMCGLLRGKESGRKFRLFACACCRRVEHLLTDERSHHALEVLERFLDGGLTFKEYDVGERAAADACAAQAQIVGASESQRGISEADRVRLFAHMLAAQAVAACFSTVTSVAKDCCGALRGCGTAELMDDIQLRETGERIEAAERTAQAALLRDIFGNPFHPIELDPAWRTPAAVSLAKKMYHSHDFGEMSELADLLQDAGCENERILNHCRYSTLQAAEHSDAPVGAGRKARNTQHVRGCWVVDLVIGKS
jgi:hypothetical protein